MSYAARLIHDLTIVRTTFDDAELARDEYGQPDTAPAEIETRGLIQPKRTNEMADSRSAGAQIADHTIFLLPQLLYQSDAIVDAGGQRYQVTGIRSFEFGRTPHIEVDAIAVTASNDNQVEVGS